MKFELLILLQAGLAIPSNSLNIPKVISCQQIIDDTACSQEKDGVCISSHRIMQDKIRFDLNRKSFKSKFGFGKIDNIGRTIDGRLGFELYSYPFRPINITFSADHRSGKMTDEYGRNETYRCQQSVKSN